MYPLRIFATFPRFEPMILPAFLVSQDASKRPHVATYHHDGRVVGYAHVLVWLPVQDNAPKTVLYHIPGKRGPGGLLETTLNYTPPGNPGEVQVSKSIEEPYR